MDVLLAIGYGGRMRSDTTSDETMHDVDINSRFRSALPKGHLNNDKFLERISPMVMVPQ